MGLSFMGESRAVTGSPCIVGHRGASSVACTGRPAVGRGRGGASGDQMRNQKAKAGDKCHNTKTAGFDVARLQLAFDGFPDVLPVLSVVERSRPLHVYLIPVCIDRNGVEDVP